MKTPFIDPHYGYLQYDKDSNSCNHISAVHVFHGDPVHEEVRFVEIIDCESTSIYLPHEYEKKFGLKLIEGRIRTIGVRTFFEEESSDRTWYVDQWFHKGNVYFERGDYSNGK